MRGRAVILLLAFAALGVGGAAAEPIVVCAKPDGQILEVRVLPGFDQAALVAAMQQEGTLPASPDACWAMDPAMLPANSRPDPLRRGDGIGQRHRWRRGPGHTVIVDSNVRQPHWESLEAYLRTHLAEPERLAVILSTPLGDNLFRIVRQRDMRLLRALLKQVEARVGKPGETLSQSEVETFRIAAETYEVDLE